MDKEYTKDDEYTLKEKFVSSYQKHKFPITLEPVVFFGSLSYGLNVVKQNYGGFISYISIYVGYKISIDLGQNLSKQVKLFIRNL